MNEEINTVSEEQILHNKLSFEINQELIHLMKRIVELQQENARLKDKIEKAIMYIENTYDDVVSNFTEDKPMTNFKARKELLEILKEN